MKISTYIVRKMIFETFHISVISVTKIFAILPPLATNDFFWSFVAILGNIAQIFVTLMINIATNFVAIYWQYGLNYGHVTWRMSHVTWVMSNGRLMFIDFRIKLTFSNIQYSFMCNETRVNKYRTWLWFFDRPWTVAK